MTALAKLGALGLSGMLGLLAGCSANGGNHTDASALVPADAAPIVSAAPSATPSTSTTSPAEQAPSDFREAARLLEYERAYQMLQQLPATELAKPDIRLARGRLALLSGHHADAVNALAGLEKELPLLASEIMGWHTEAAAVAGPHEPAAKQLAASPKVRDLLLAAEAYLKADKAAEARKLVDTAIKRAERTRRRSDEAAGHALRARLAEKAKQPAIAVADWRWLIEHSPRPERVREAIAGIDRVKGALGVRTRADALARSTTRDTLQQTLTTLAALKAKHPQDKLRIEMASARSHYKARDYAGAAAAFDTVAASGSPFAAEAKYYAARCVARQGKPDDAIKRYAALSAAHTNVWAERGSYRYAEMLLLNGRYAEAAKAYSRYLSRFKRTKDREAARYGHALAMLSSGEAKRARKSFRALRKKANDRRFRARLQHLEAVAAQRAGDMKRARKLWLKLIADQPLPWPAMAAHARLSAAGEKTLPPLIGPAPAAGYLPLPLKLPPAVAKLHALGLDEDAERHLTGLEQTTAERYPKREGEALCQLYSQLSGARRRQRVGNRAVALAMLMRPPSAAERWAWQCVYPYPFADIVQAAEKRRALPGGLVYAVMRQESAFATTATSPVGARGLMQLMPNTARRAAAESGTPYQVDAITQPRTNIGLGAFYLGKLKRNFAGSLPLAVAAYNAGPHAVQSWLRATPDRDLDVWVARIPYRETREYVERVMANFARYQYLAGGAEAVTPLPLQLPEATEVAADAY